MTDCCTNGGAALTATAAETRAASYRPLVDIIENDTELTILADLPGASASSIDVSYRDGVLSLLAPVEDRAPEGGTGVLQEYNVGSYRRTFRIAQHVDADAIAAEYRDGVLTLHLPKVAAVRPRQITVTSPTS
ncbi:MAG: Hsp20/alpha crystallin family protein [Planctomycetota bacterium]